MPLLGSGLWKDPVSGVLDAGRWAECWEMFERTGADCCLGNTISEKRKIVFRGCSQQCLCLVQDHFSIPGGGTEEDFSFRMNVSLFDRNSVDATVSKVSWGSSLAAFQVMGRRRWQEQGHCS